MAALRTLLHVVAMWTAGYLAAIKATVRRLLLGPTLPSWSWRTEWTVAALRAVIGTAVKHRDDTNLQRLGIRARTPVPARLRSRVMVRRSRLGSTVADRAVPRHGNSGFTLLYFHGGGYVFGNPGIHRQFIAQLVAATGATAIAPVYRLAPHNKFPAAVDDAEEAYEAVLRSGVSSDRIVVGGDSAGGGLALALLLRLRERGRPLPAGAVLLSPYTDLDHRSYTVVANARTDYLPVEVMSLPNDFYADDDLRAHPEASPANADLTGLPPLLILAGGAEMLLGDSLELERHANRDGVSVELFVEPEMVHVWPIVVGWEPASQRALDAIDRWLATL